MFVSSVEVIPREGEPRGLAREGLSPSLAQQRGFQSVAEITPERLADLVGSERFGGSFGDKVNRSADLVLVAREVDMTEPAELRPWLEPFVPKLSRPFPDPEADPDDAMHRLLSLVATLSPLRSELFIDEQADFWRAKTVRTALPHVWLEQDQRTLWMRWTLNVTVLEGILVIAWHRGISDRGASGGGLVDHLASLDAEAHRASYEAGDRQPAEAVKRRSAETVANAYVDRLLDRYEAAARTLESHASRWEARFFKTIEREPETLRVSKQVGPLRRIRETMAMLKADLDDLDTRGLTGSWPEGTTKRPPDVARKLETSLAITDRIREDVRDSFASIAAAASAQQLEQATHMQELARREQGQFEALQRRVSALTVLFLVPSLVAGIYGANQVKLLGGDDPWLRTGAMGLLIVVLGAAVLWVQRRGDGSGAQTGPR